MSLAVQGLYRTCGVKSKIEQICVYFEQSDPIEDNFSLTDVHVMNIASVIKLYLRRLPEVITEVNTVRVIHLISDCSP